MKKKKKIKPRSKSRIGKWIKAIVKFFLILFALSVLMVLAMRWLNPASSSIMVQRQISSLIDGDFEFIDYDWVSFEEISPFMPIAVVAAEDQNFPNHYGFDLKEIQKAYKQYQKGRRIRGASTITQQVAKNLFLWEGKSFVRKGVEAYFTVLIEFLWSKERILEVYLNIAELGKMTFGVEAASQKYFKKSAAKLTLSQSARLAAILPNPIRFSASIPSGYVLRRQAWIIRQINSLGGKNYLKDI